MKKYTLTVTCPSTRGIVAAVAGFLAGKGCNITDSSQFDDIETGRFFMRVSFLSEEHVGLEELRRDMAAEAARFAMDYVFHDEAEKMKVVIMVSRFGHCLNDLLYRSRIGALPIDIVAVISNHMDYQKGVVNQGIPFHFIRVTKGNKPQAEGELM
ncbi:MAG: ACT domain-containing protein, partial [Paracoccus sp.]|nr:ACT domain-containing protein [Paracoccus sp. (in: a-proteobacteria)]